MVSPAKPTYPADQPAEPTDYCVASAAFRLDAENHGRTLFAAVEDDFTSSAAMYKYTARLTVHWVVTGTAEGGQQHGKIPR